MKHANKRPIVLSIAGSDSSGGAGIQADIKTISATGNYAASVITAITAQNTQGVHDVYPLPIACIEKQIDAVFNDLDIAAVKVGMLGDDKTITLIEKKLKKYRPAQMILDPVMFSKNNFPLLDTALIDQLKNSLFPLATLITPNVPEALLLSECSIETLDDMSIAAETIGKRYGTNVLLKGGHLHSDQASDILFIDLTKTLHYFHSERINTIHTHGTGCTLSSAIASYLAQNNSLHNAIVMAKHYVTEAIQSGTTLAIGHGRGPVDHFYFL